jgi:MFS family permease
MPECRVPTSAAPISAFRAALLPCALLFGAMLNLTLVVPGLKELVVDELGGDVGDAALFFTVEMAAYLVFAPVWGVLSDRTGRRRPLIVAGFAASGVAYLGYLAIDSIPWLLALRFVQGAAAIAGWSTALALVLDRADTTTRPRLAGMAGASMILGVGLGAPFGGAVAATFGARAPLAAAGALFLLQAVAALALAEPPRREHRPRLSEIGAALVERPRLLIPWTLYFVERFTVGLFVVVFPLYLAASTGAGPGERGRALAFYLLPFAFCQLATWRLARRFGTLPTLATGTALYGLAYAALGRLDAGNSTALLVALGLFAAVIFPPTLSLTSEWSADDTRASALAGFNLAGSLGFALGPVAGAWAQGVGGYLLAFDLAAGLALAAAAGLAGLALAPARRS